MVYRANPFLERVSERTTSDQEFVNLFSPNILEKIPDEALENGVHIFRSPPGGGKTTLLRAFTPNALRAFWNARHTKGLNESFRSLVAREVLDEREGPQVLGVLLSCASGYTDLPPGALIEQQGLFRALINCRIVLRTLKSLALHIGHDSIDELSEVNINYTETAKELSSIPISDSVIDLVQWAERSERNVYMMLDSIAKQSDSEMLSHIRLDSVLWLQEVSFVHDSKTIVPKRLLMIDDLHKLRRKQRKLLIGELAELRSQIPIWLSERNIALGDELLYQGLREGRDVKQYALEEFWTDNKGQHQFANYAQSILDRRINNQSLIPSGSFSQHLVAQIKSDDFRENINKGILFFHTSTTRYSSNPRYHEWLTYADEFIDDPSMETLRELFKVLILIARDLSKRQLTIELNSLSTEEFRERDSSQVQAAADIFIHKKLKVPYYYGINKLCVMATNNIEELLSLAAELFDGLKAKQVLRKTDLPLSPIEQENLIKKIAKRKLDFVPKSHTEGIRAQRLIDSIGRYCWEKTFLVNAPYAPGVTGVRLSDKELSKLRSNQGKFSEHYKLLRKVLSESVAENLLVTKPSAASTNRDSGTIFYLNRTLCVHFELPLQMSQWQDIRTEEMYEWMEYGRKSKQFKLLEIE